MNPFVLWSVAYIYAIVWFKKEIEEIEIKGKIALYKSSDKTEVNVGKLEAPGVMLIIWVEKFGYLIASLIFKFVLSFSFFWSTKI